ncbi:hypothetical protein BDV11DRAFT_110878 [Aspergillus similis]
MILRHSWDYRGGASARLMLSQRKCSSWLVPLGKRAPMMPVIAWLICISGLETVKVELVLEERERLSKHTSDTQILHWRCATRYENQEFP